MLDQSLATTHPVGAHPWCLSEAIAYLTTLFIQRLEIYSHLEKVTDRFEDVANEISGLVIDHA